MKTLSTEFRRQLERTVIEARDVAETGARVALEAIAVHHHEFYEHMAAGQRTLSRRLRAHARQLGDRRDTSSGGHGINHLVHECAYEHWHGMLFARFLAENDLLIEPAMGVAISLEECEELAKEEGVDKWELAARFAHHMLPQVFRPDHPVFEVKFAREHRLKLEGLVEGLPSDVFKATDSLGWVYQFWQSKKKDEVNRSEVKIGAAELPAVTQLFTEPYMVQFLLHNSLGAWWVSRNPDKPCPIDLDYLRKAEKETPAAGGFEGWPDDLSEFRLLDPCCGSGHFLVAAFLMLVPMRMVLEDISAAEAVDAVLRDNLHGLELDQRCVAIAAFAIALEAWRYPDAEGFRTLPKLNLAWCGQPVAEKRQQWLEFAGGDSRLEAGMDALFDTFCDAPVLGSLIDPTRSVSEDLLTAGFAELQPLLDRALREHTGDEEWEETAIAALGLAEATRLLSSHYHLVITNVPYLVRGKQNEHLRKFAETWYPKAKNDLANVFLERCLEFSRAEDGAVTQIVMPQNWLFLPSYKAQRENLLRKVSWDLLVLLGSRGFETVSGEVVNVVLLTLEKARPDALHPLVGLDVSHIKTLGEKKAALIDKPILMVTQSSQLTNPDQRVTLSELSSEDLLKNWATPTEGLSTGDSERYLHAFWEHSIVGTPWVKYQTSPASNSQYSGFHQILRWEDGQGTLSLSEGARIQGNAAWGQRGVLIARVESLRATPYWGTLFDKSCVAIIPNDEQHVRALREFCRSSLFRDSVRQLDKKTYVTTSVFGNVSFDPQEHVPSSNPDDRPYSNDPVQWLFHGHVRAADSPLDVLVARMLGYHWPAENDPEIELSDEARAWVEKAKALHLFKDEDGIVCIPPIRREPSAGERLLKLLAASFGDAWNDGVRTKLLAETDSPSLDDWLRNRFFEQHCKLFHHRPFVWHIWDGRKRDGFHALVNYHNLAESGSKGRQLLESLTYSYLGDWIARQQDGVKRSEGGAEDRLAAALELQKRLIAILEGEPPFDIFIRWKPVEEQPIGWEPDINDGVRLNIRPFMAQEIPSGKKGAGILRAKPNIHWKKDRGKEPVREQEQFPWFWNSDKFTGERVNDVHLAIAEKRAARDRGGG